MALDIGFGHGWLFWLFYWVPVLLIGASRQVAGSRKIIWMGLAVVLSWITYVVFFGTETEREPRATH